MKDLDAGYIRDLVEAVESRKKDTPGSVNFILLPAGRPAERAQTEYTAMALGSLAGLAGLAGLFVVVSHTEWLPTIAALSAFNIIAWGCLTYHHHAAEQCGPCHGSGEVLDSTGRVTTCRSCGGTGKSKE